ncbi:MAG: hypothetical protein ACPGR8_10320 [Limisphaerales bacterium]
MSAGRSIDAAFKRFATTGKTPAKQTAAHAACRRGIRALRKVATVDGANVFLKHGPIRTHADGVGWIGKTRCVIELKSTTKTMADFEACYHLPCRNVPALATTQWSNTEANHHQLQLGWTVFAMRETNPTVTAVTGVLLVVATDAAKVVPLDPQFAKAATWRRLLAAAPPQVAAGGAITVANRVPQWPTGRGCRALERAVGSKVTAVVAQNRVAQTECGGVAVCATKPKREWTPSYGRMLVRAARAVGGSPMWVLIPTAAGWRVQPLQATKPTGV